VSFEMERKRERDKSRLQRKKKRAGGRVDGYYK
jgi:hypothetical protein